MYDIVIDIATPLSHDITYNCIVQIATVSNKNIK